MEEDMNEGPAPIPSSDYDNKITEAVKKLYEDASFTKIAGTDASIRATWRTLPTKVKNIKRR